MFLNFVQKRNRLYLGVDYKGSW